MLEPVFVIDRDGWISVFGTADLAARHVEAPDVSDDEYVAYDAGGQVLTLTVAEAADPAPRSWLRRVRLQAPVTIEATGSYEPERLADILAHAVGEDAPSSGDRSPLAVLVAEAASRAAKKELLRARIRRPPSI